MLGSLGLSSTIAFLVYAVSFGSHLVQCEKYNILNSHHLTFLAKRQFWDHELVLLLRGGDDDADPSAAAAGADSDAATATKDNKEDDENTSSYLKVTEVADLTSIISEGEEQPQGDDEEEKAEAQKEKEASNPVENDKEKEEFVFSASVAGDGSEKDPDGLPDRYLRMAKGDRAKAKKAFEHTLEWRKEHNVDSILKRPHPRFDLCRKIFPVFILGRDEKDNVVIIQRPGLIDFSYGKPFGFSRNHLLMHYVYMCEYLWNILENNSNSSGVMTTIIDMKNIGWSTFSNKDKRQFVMNFVSMMSEHYPQRSFKTLIINVPQWSNIPWQAVRPILRESTRKKIQLLSSSKRQDAVLRSVLGENNVPPELLHNYVPHDDVKTEAKSLVKSDLDNDLRLFCLDRLRENGESMIELV